VAHHFIVTNEGAIAHEIMTIPVLDMGRGMDMEELDAVAMIEEDDLPAGETETMDLIFTEPAAAGGLEFACYGPGTLRPG
jgi:hypothetical protein